MLKASGYWLEGQQFELHLPCDTQSFSALGRLQWQTISEKPCKKKTLHGLVQTVARSQKLIQKYTHIKQHHDTKTTNLIIYYSMII